MTNTRPAIKRIEMKFQLDTSLAAEVQDWARDHLGVDENCNVDSGDSYDINTLYLDTPELDLLHRTGEVGAAKHRIRRYGNEQTLWVETKRKKKQVVRKNRTAVFESDLMPRLIACPTGVLVSDKPAMPSVDRCGEQSTGAESADLWCGDWFLDRIVERRLQPTIQIAYRRFARTSCIDGENLRLTIDSQMTAAASAGWNVPSTTQSHARAATAFGEFQILELKFHDRMPHLFKHLLTTFPIPATGFSKYRTAMQAMETTAVCQGQERPRYA